MYRRLFSSHLCSQTHHSIEFGAEVLVDGFILDEVRFQVETISEMDMVGLLF